MFKCVAECFPAMFRREAFLHSVDALRSCVRHSVHGTGVSAAHLIVGLLVRVVVEVKGHLDLPDSVGDSLSVLGEP